jgi:hypothetical protein
VGERTNVHKLLVGKPQGKKSLGVDERYLKEITCKSVNRNQWF